MGANAYQYDIQLNLNAETKLAKAQIGELQRQLQDVSNLKFNFNGIEKLTDEINEASTAAMKLQTNLQNALNPNTGTLDFSKFNNSIMRSGESISGLAQSLLKLGPQGEKAFVSLAESISRSEVPLMRTNKLINGLWDNLKKAAGWQVSSSVIHGVMGQYQQAVGYAKALDKSLTDIRIVTGQSADQMARFAKEANAAAKKLSTTTTDYTNASLIYYQQGLSDSEVKKRSDITIKMANATGTSAEKVSDQLTSIWNNFDNGVKSLEHYADVMTALGAATASSTDEIAKGIQKFAAISDTVGLSYEYAASALATITATTRESADTVGNSLKTLFSRIQGLQLGDTLDDGTTLNKYSTALAKVGISIKDASGNLRDMNSILDDMGAKWHTLAEDQQMALAQTVGGVRQYTQIMTLMENWDFFKENLNTANSATGTLTMQADIYAESWEAASQRMRASMESVWDTLIDSDSFKSLLNIGSIIVDGINSILAGIGGGGGVLATAAGIFGTVFKTQISQTLVDVMHTVTHLTPKAMEAERQKRADTIDEMINTVNDPGATPYMGDYERERTIDILKMQRDASGERSKRRSRMSSDAQAMDIELESSINTLYDTRKSLAAKMDGYQAQIDRGLQSPDNDLTFFSRSYDLKKGTITSSVKDAKRALENAKKHNKNTASYEARLAEAEAQVAAQQNYDFGLALLRDVEDSGATAQKNASLGKVLEQLGIREANAEARISNIATNLFSKKDPGEYSVEEGKLIQKDKRGKLLGGEAYGLFADLLGLTADERAKFVNNEKFADPARQALGDKLKKSLEGLENFINKDLKEQGINDGQERSRLIRAYLQKAVGGIQSDALAGLGVNTTIKGMERSGAIDIYQGAKGKRSEEIRDENVQQGIRGLKAQQDKLIQSNYASAATGTATGIFQTFAGIEGIKGASESLLNGDILGAGFGAASAIYNLKAGRQNFAEALSDLNPLTQYFKDRTEKINL